MGGVQRRGLGVVSLNLRSTVSAVPSFHCLDGRSRWPRPYMLVRMRTGSFLGGETRRSKVIRDQHPHAFPMFSAHVHIFECMYGSARIRL